MYVYEEIFDTPAEEPVSLMPHEFVELKKNICETSPKYVKVFCDEPDQYGYPCLEPYFKTYKLELKHYKAYSYCGTVCKNYLIYKNIQYSKNRQRNLPYDEMVEDFNRDPKYSTQEEENHFSMVEKLIKETSTEIKNMMNNKEENALTNDELKVGIALTELLDNWEEVLNVDGSNKLQKSSVLYFLREETMMTTKAVRENMKAYKKAYYLLKKGIVEDE